ncbi:hypothetical protein [Pseudoalteromonas sp. NBT06-2]|uniref:hypothetical protein n=1 Tax=Pseudoalteromonas sp. NBT06-2 TaxID=2025950 RepID=UPI001483A3F8|nr:hypothetical protein [Pseudoalteromonas sp. NBT06-2]
MQQQAQKMVIAMSKNNNLVKDGLEKNVANDELSLVVSEINEITNMNTPVATAIKQQS